MSRNYSIVWLSQRKRMDPLSMTMDESNRDLPGKYFIPRDAKMDKL